MPEGYRDNHFAVVEVADSRGWSELLNAQLGALERAEAVDRPWMFCELHNPWSRAAIVVDSWALLDLCQHRTLVDALVECIGEDVVLFDSQILPVPALGRHELGGWTSDADFFPLNGSGESDGVVVRIPFGPHRRRRVECNGTDSGKIEYGPNQILLHRGDFEYRTPDCQSDAQWEYRIRYYSARRHFDRDPTHPKQVRLMERYPWVNYSKMPHWLVNGQDRADNDFVTGFHTKIGHWTTARQTLAAG